MLYFFSVSQMKHLNIFGGAGERAGRAGLPHFRGVNTPAQRFSNNAKEEKTKVRSIKNRLGQDRPNLGFLEN